MKRLAAILFLALALSSNAAVTEFAPGTNYMLLPTYDSFDIGPAGNGHFCWDMAGLMLINPTNMGRFRYAGQSGQNNNGFLTNNLPAVAMPLIGSMAGTNEVFSWYGASGNSPHAGNSNYYGTNFEGILKFPMQSWTEDQRITNDFPWTTNNLHARYFGDSTYYGATNGNITGAVFYSNIASNISTAMGFLPYIDSVSHTFFECAVFDTNQTAALELYYPTNIPPDVIQDSHPQKRALQAKRHVDDFRQMAISAGAGTITNVWSCYVDAATATVKATNCFAAGTVTKTPTTISFPAKALRLGPPIETPDGFHTNDMRQLFVYFPSYSNAFNETLVVSNLANGIWVSYEGTDPVATNTVSNGVLSNNYYTVYSGKWYWQKMAALNYTRQVRDINTNDASSISGQTYMRNFGSFAGVAFPTNHTVTQYTAFMLPQEKTMEALDVAAFAAVQPITQTLTFSNTTPVTTSVTVQPASTVALNVPVVLDASVSTNATLWTWTQTNGPALGSNFIGQAMPCPMLISVTNAGLYGFQVVATDGTTYATNGCTVTFVEPSGGRTNFVDLTLTTNCLNTNYSVTTRVGNGSDGNAYTNAQSAVNNSMPGDLILLRGGVYSRPVNPVLINQGILMVTNGGTATAPLRFENYNGEYVQFRGWGYRDTDTNSDGLADGPTNLTYREDQIIVWPGADFVQIKGFDLTNAQNSALDIYSSWCYVHDVVAHDPWAGGLGVVKKQLGTVTDVTGDVFRWCESDRSRHWVGISLGLENLSTFGYVSNCAVVECIAYRNGYQLDGTEVLPFGNDSQGGGNSGGFWTTKFFADNAFFNPTNGIVNYGQNIYFVRSIAISNCDDGFAFDHDNSLIEDNRSLGNGPTGGMGFKILRAETGGRWRGNASGYNLHRGYEIRYYTNTSVFFNNNTAVRNPEYGIWTAGTDATGILCGTNNVSVGNVQGDVLWPSQITNSPNWTSTGSSVPSQYRGDPKLVNTNLVIDVSGLFNTGWSVNQRRTNLEAQIKTAFSPAAGSPIIGIGFPIVGYLTNTPLDMGAFQSGLAVAPSPRFFLPILK